MAYMDFIILKVNGTDVSSSPHAEAVRAFLSAKDPIVVEVKRRISNIKHSSSISSVTNDENTIKSDSSGRTPDKHLVSIGVQTELMACTGWLDDSPISEHHNGFDDCLAPEIDLEEVTLRKCSSDERLGLTVCYSSAAGSGSEEADGGTPSTEVYISDIVPESVAGRDGRLRQGDQILQVNGRDVANKEETESLFAENRNAVTLLVSRCLYQDEDELEAGDYFPDLPPGDYRNIAYQNSLIEQLIREQAIEPPSAFRSEPSVPPKVPLHASPDHSKSQPETLNINIRSHFESMNHEISLLDHRMENVLLCRNHQLNSNNIDSQMRAQIENVNHELCLLDQRMENIHLGKKGDKHRAPQIVAPLESDTEHIYETIPETDPEMEPIYSSPYEASLDAAQQQQNIVEQWLKNQGCSWQGRKHPSSTPSPKTNSNWNKTSKSNSSGEDHENSSSAYNTGGSCNSNPLTLELNFNTDSRDKDVHRSTLVLCAPPQVEINNLDIKIDQATADAACKCSRHKKVCSPRQSPKNTGSKITSPISPTVVTSGTAANATTSAPLPPTPVNMHVSDSKYNSNTATIHHTLSAETMYTNMANLQQTMMLQQQLFRQALVQNSTARENVQPPRVTSNFTAPSLSQYQFVSSQQMYTTCLEPVRLDERMEWKVKRRQDGTRYITRRPVRNRILRDRALRINEERSGLTTEDDTMSEIKIGRYWTKEERKKQVERSRERRHRQESITAAKNQQLEDNRQDKITHSPRTSGEKTNTTSGKRPGISEPHKKTLRKKNNNEEDFTSVQQTVHANKLPGGGKMIGLLSVTTV